MSQVKRLNIQIRQKKEQLEEISVKAQGLRSFDYTADRVQSMPADRMSADVGRMLEIEAQIRARLIQYMEAKARIIDEIHMLKEPKYIEILYKRYVEEKELTVIAKEIPYEYTYACHVHGEALKAFEDKILNNANITNNHNS